MRAHLLAGMLILATVPVAHADSLPNNTGGNDAARHGAAEAADERSREEAKSHYAMGMKLFNVGEYGKARDEFKAAYLAKEDPAFLYNLGQCARLLGDMEEAVARYRAYLRERPNAPNKKEVASLIDNGEKQLELKRRAAGTPTSPIAPSGGGLVTHEEPGPSVAPPQPVMTQGGAPAAGPAPPALMPTGEPSPTTQVEPLVAPPSRGSTESPTVGKSGSRWWLWTAIGVVAAGVVVGGVLAFTLPKDASIPMTDLGNMHVQ